VTDRSWEEHVRAVERLARSYEAIPPGQPVRLAKQTTNLFRVRSASSAPGLDVSGLTGVIEVDARPAEGPPIAEVQGMCTYEDLVDATLPHGLMPLVVPQLRTITLGGAVTGLGIEATSFRSGLPHESVLEMDVFTGAGEVVTTRPGDDLFDAFPNSYGSLGYATRLRIELERVPPYVALRHVRFDDPSLLAKTIEEIVQAREFDGERVDGLDGVAFAPGEYYLTLARWTEGLDTPWPSALREAVSRPSDYTGQQVYYRSIQERETDLLTTYDYLWRWDTDWFWCSGAFGAQHPLLRRLWPASRRRSDVYMRLLKLDRQFAIADRLDRRAGRPLRERVVQDVEVPVDRLPEFLDWFDAEIGMRPVWLCPLVARRAWTAYPLEPAETYVNVGFWGTVHVGPEAVNAPKNRAIETKVHELGGHKSLYSEAFYDRETFDRLYNAPALAAVKRRYDPDDRLTTLYDKAVRSR
jgi:FAD/FMN-containing dehydrogenase